MEVKTEVIILKSWKSKEYNRIYSIYSKEFGKMLISALGVRKMKAKLASSLEPITESELFLVKCRSLDRVKGAITLKSYLKIKKNLDALLLSKETIEILDKLVEFDLHSQEIFLALKDFLKFLDESSISSTNFKQTNAKLAQLSFFWKVIFYSGYFPRLNHCIFCQQKITEKDFYDFYISQGISCGCQKRNDFKFKLHKNTIKLIKFFVSQDISAVAKIKIGNKDLLNLKQFTKINLERILDKKVVI